MHDKQIAEEVEKVGKKIKCEGNYNVPGLIKIKD